MVLFLAITLFYFYQIMNYSIDSLTSSSTASNANMIVSLADVNEYLNIDESTSATVSAFYSNCISRVSDRIESYLNLPVKAQDFLGYYDCIGCNSLYLNNYPILNVSSLKHRTSPISDWQNVITQGSIENYLLIYAYKIELYNHNFYSGQKSIEIKYRAGYENIPDDIKQVALEMVVMIGKESSKSMNGDNGRLGIGTMNGGSNNFSTSYISLDERHEKILDRYKKLHI
jgi:hypothetical protein